jgi:hypothetical protein
MKVLEPELSSLISAAVTEGAEFVDVIMAMFFPFKEDMTLNNKTEMPEPLDFKGGSSDRKMIFLSPFAKDIR